MKKVVFYTALSAWILSFIVHVNAQLGNDLSDVYPVMGLHFLIFLLILPIVLILRKNPEIKELEETSWNWKRRNPLLFWELALENCPLSLKILMGACFAYALINMAISIKGSPFVTSFSGFWMAAYAAIIAISYPFSSNKKE